MLWRPLLFSCGPKAQGKIVAVSRAPRGNRLTISWILSSQYLLYTMISWGFFSCHIIAKTNTWYNSKYLTDWFCMSGRSTPTHLSCVGLFSDCDSLVSDGPWVWVLPGMSVERFRELRWLLLRVEWKLWLRWSQRKKQTNNKQTKKNTTKQTNKQMNKQKWNK